MAGYRFIYEPQRAAQGDRPVAGASRSVQPAPSAPTARSAPTPATKPPQISGFQIFEISLNLANVLVGALGIWLTVRGLRSQPPVETAALRRDR